MYLKEEAQWNRHQESQVQVPLMVLTSYVTLNRLSPCPPMSYNYISSQRGQWYSSIWGHRERGRHGPQDLPILCSTNSNTGSLLGRQKWAGWWAKTLQQNVKLFQQNQRPALWEIQAALVQILLSHLLGWRAYAIAIISLHFSFSAVKLWYI